MSLRGAVLSTGYKAVLRPGMFRAYGGDPEAIHERLIAVLGSASRSAGLRAALRVLHAVNGDPVTVAGVRFPGLAGLAAGMDKDGLAVRAWHALGFSFAELGTVTALAQPGNPRPRVFRLRNSHALINRMGFNNLGAHALAQHLQELDIWRGNMAAGIPLGISIGKSKVVELDDAVADYVTSLRVLAPHADYLAINVSSPNTPGLRQLQGLTYLRELLATLTQEAGDIAQQSSATPVPIFVKIAPDLGWADIDDVLASATDAGVRGIIATNTTIDRQGLAPQDQPVAGEPGGLSGAPLTARARMVVSYVNSHTDLPVIASGGVMSTDDARALRDAGASLIQLYTGFIYEGTGLVTSVNALKPTRRPV